MVFFKYHFDVSSSYSCMMVAIHRMSICSWMLLYHVIPLILSCLLISGAVAQWLALATRDRKVVSSIPGRGIPRNNLG